MDRKSLSLVLTALLILSVGIAGATGFGSHILRRGIVYNTTNSTAVIDTLLRSYSVPNAVIANLHNVNLTYNGLVYIALYNNTGALNFVVNYTNDTLLMDQGIIFNVIQNYTLQQALSQSNVNSIVTQMQKYQNTAQGPLNDCLTETGLNQPGATCTFQNYCQACAEVPVCHKVLTALGGTSTPFGYGIMAFQNNYTSLQKNYSEFYSATSGINTANVGERVAQINTVVANITLISSTIWENAIFPPPANISLTGCTGSSAGLTGNVPVHEADWYCNAVGFCGFLTQKDAKAEGGGSGGFNFTLLNNLKSSLSALTALPLTSAQIEAIAASANATTTGYVLPLLHSEKSSQLAKILNTSLSSYNSIVNGSEIVLTHVSNASLSASLAAMESGYAKLTSQYLGLNLSLYNATLSLQLKNLTSLYHGVSATYNSIVSGAGNNTNTIIALQLEGNSGNQALSSLAYQQFQINTEISGIVSNTIAVKAQLSAIQTGLSGIKPVTQDPVTAVSRYLGSTSAMAIAPIFGMSYPSNVSLAPIFASLPAIILGIVLLVVIFFLYRKVTPQKQSRISTAARRWLVIDDGILGIAAAVVIAYMVLSLILSFNNNTMSAPISVFQSALAHASTVGIVLNGTQTPGMLTCAAKLTAAVKSLNKVPVTLFISNGKCTVNNETQTSDQCLNSFASHGLPMVILTNSTSGGLGVYSLYGTTIWETGTSSQLAQCSAATALSG